MIKQVIAACILSSTLFAGEIFVNVNSGKAGNPGTKEAPLPSLRHALKKVVPGDTIYIMPSPNPILDNVFLNNVKGTPDKPITIDCMNNIFLGASQLDPKEWQMVKPGLYRKKIITGRNMYARFFLVFNGKINRMGRIQKAPGAKPYKKVKDLAPGEWTVVVGKKVSDKRPHPQFEVEYFVRLPENAKSLADSGITEPKNSRSDGVCLRGNSKNLIIRNVIAKNFYNDGYNIHGKCENIHFENIASVDCGDDGISAHEACTISLKNGVFIGSSTAICHIQDVTATHENVYAEKITGREIYLVSSGRNDIKNAYIIADSQSGCYWSNKEQTPSGELSNIYAISNNPKSVFVHFDPRKSKMKFSNIRLANFKQIIKSPEVKTLPASEIKGKIEAARKSLFALFGGNLEKALQ